MELMATSPRRWRAEDLPDIPVLDESLGYELVDGELARFARLALTLGKTHYRKVGRPRRCPCALASARRRHYCRRTTHIRIPE